MLTRNHLLRILRVSCFFLFAGRAWQHLVWDMPLRTFLWDQQLMEGVISTFTGMTWFEYATSEVQDAVIQNIKIGFGIFYAVCAVISLLVTERRRWTGWFMLAGSVALMILSLLYFKEKFFHLGQLLEYAIQVGCPLLLYFSVFSNQPLPRVYYGSLVLIALTFTCHGLYAYGYYPQPGHFVDMTIRGFGVGEDTARSMLKVFGALDFALSIGIFIPMTARYCLAYAVLWGFATAAARVTTNFYIDFPWQTLNQWIPETLYRLPHGLVPLFALLLLLGHLGSEDSVLKRMSKLS